MRPADVGLVAGPRRRVSGLRREEIAALIGVSADYYLRLEQGRVSDPSPQVLDSLSKALRLDDSGTAHLHHLAGAAPPADLQVADDLVTLVDQLAVPALVVNRYLDCLTSNAAARALSKNFTPGGNLVRGLFLDPTERDLHLDWETTSVGIVGGLRQIAAVSPANPRLAGLVDELCRRSPPFRALWSRSDIAEMPPGAAHMYHPAVGELHLQRRRFDIPDSDGQYLLVFHAVPGTEWAQRLAALQDRGPAQR